MYLPVPVNFIFIGFEGKGNKGIETLFYTFEVEERFSFYFH